MLRVASRPDDALDLGESAGQPRRCSKTDAALVADLRRAADTPAEADRRVPEHEPEPFGRAQSRRHVQVWRQERGRTVSNPLTAQGHHGSRIE
jgi:hypothetical protein